MAKPAAPSVPGQSSAAGVYGAATLLTAVGLSTLVVVLGLQGALQSLVAGIFIFFERPHNEDLFPDSRVSIRRW